MEARGSSHLEWKIWAFSSAAPSFIAENCTVIDSDGKTVLRGY